MKNLIEMMRNMAADVVQGVEDPIKAYAELKRVEAVLKDCIGAITDDLLNEASKHDKTFEMYGCKFEQRNGATRYDFKDIPEWVQLNAELKAFEAKSKEAYKAMQSGLVVFNTEDGTEFPLPKVSNSRDSVTVKFLEK